LIIKKKNFVSFVVFFLIRHRKSGSRVIVKLIDRGDEIIVDMSELLQIDNKFSTIAAFAEPFRLHGYDELVSKKYIH
jgi:hypothetical protein